MNPTNKENHKNTVLYTLVYSEKIVATGTIDCKNLVFQTMVSLYKINHSIKVVGIMIESQVAYKL